MYLGYFTPDLQHCQSFSVLHDILENENHHKLTYSIQIIITLCLSDILRVNNYQNHRCLMMTHHIYPLCTSNRHHSRCPMNRRHQYNDLPIEHFDDPRMLIRLDSTMLLSSQIPIRIVTFSIRLW